MSKPKRVKISCEYNNAIVENDHDKRTSVLALNDFTITFNTRDEVEEFKAMIDEAMTFWAYTNKPHD
mgnify:CR=1 FL=1